MGRKKNWKENRIVRKVEGQYAETSEKYGDLKDGLKRMVKTDNYLWILDTMTIPYGSCENYCSDAGFNITTEVEHKEYKSKFYDPLTDKEKETLNFLFSEGYHYKDKKDGKEKSCLCSRKISLIE